MSDKVHIATAGNVLAPALAALESLGYRVSHVIGTTGARSELIQAENDRFCLRAEDPLLLLGLAKLVECRGSAWAPTDEEVERFSRFDTA